LNQPKPAGQAEPAQYMKRDQLFCVDRKKCPTLVIRDSTMQFLATKWSRKIFDDKGRKDIFSYLLISLGI
jgi:hypothetical protein